MVTINKNSANILPVTVTELTTISPVNYLIEFKDKLTKRSTFALLGNNRSNFTDRFDEFLLTDKESPNPLLAEVHLNEGQYIYNIYELTDDQVTFLDFNNIDVTEYGLVEANCPAVVQLTPATVTEYQDAVTTNTFYEQ